MLNRLSETAGSVGFALRYLLLVLHRSDDFVAFLDKLSDAALKTQILLKDLVKAVLCLAEQVYFVV